MVQCEDKEKTDQKRHLISPTKSCLQTNKKHTYLLLFLLSPLALPRQENNWNKYFSPATGINHDSLWQMPQQYKHLW